MYNYEANRIFFVVTIQKLCQRFFRVTITPCLSQTPPTFPRPMLGTYSALYDLFAAPFLAAALHSRPMLDTDSALLGLFAAPFLSALSALHTRPMLLTDSALLG